MTKRYRVSSNGLTRCPECERHIFLAENWKETNCQFCDAHLMAGQPSLVAASLHRIRTGRSGLVAAGLLSMSLGTTGCVQDDTSNPSDQGVAADSASADAMTQRADFMVDQPVYGAVAPDAALPDASVPDAAEPDAVLDAAPDPEPQPEYGAPPEG